ncbi:MAG: hypothetical protein AB1758_18090 [Candidatus Eremiobacterota bacterium]
MIQHLPTWAQAPAQSYLDSKSLPGCQKMPLPAEQAARIDQDFSAQIDHSIQLDETPQDLAAGQPGTVRLEGDAEIHFQGSSASGEMATRVGEVAGVYQSCSPEALDVVLSMSQNGNVVTTAFHIDRKVAENSFALIPGPEFNIAG